MRMKEVSENDGEGGGGVEGLAGDGERRPAWRVLCLQSRQCWAGIHYQDDVLCLYIVSDPEFTLRPGPTHSKPNGRGNAALFNEWEIYPTHKVKTSF